MENSFIFKELKDEFSKYLNHDNKINESEAQKASWRFGIYPSTSQIYEIHSCSDENCLHNLEFYEFCLLIATIKNEIETTGGLLKFKICKTSNETKSRWDVFLGGACNPTTWRFDVAIPFLKERNITFYNPQVSQWDPSLIEIEEVAKQTCRVQLFVLDIYKTRGIASLVEVGYLSGQGRNLVLVVPKERPKTIRDIFEVELDENEFQSIDRSYLFIADLVQRQGIPLFTNVSDALKATRISLISKCMVQDLTDIDKVIPVKHAYVNVTIAIKSLKKIFHELDPSDSGAITITEVKSGLCTLFGCDINPISQTKELFAFSDFCIEYSVLLLDSIRRHQDPPRSQSLSCAHARSPTSLDVVSSFEQGNTLRSAMNVRGTLSVNSQLRDKELTPPDNEANEKTSSCLCCKRRNFKACVTWLVRWPFSKVAVSNPDETVNITIDPHNDPVTVRLVPQSLVAEQYYDVFLGGTCGSSDWREKIAIPMLEQAGCTFYDPKVSHSVWSRRLLPMEAQARENSKVLVYVITSECTSTAALVEAAHFIGQQRKVLLHVQLLSSMRSPQLSHTDKFLQSSCSFPQSSTPAPNKSPFFPGAPDGDSATSGYHSATIDTASSGLILASHSQFSFAALSNKWSISDSGRLNSADDVHDLGVSYNNISQMNPLPAVACKDHNRGRKYLIDVAIRACVPILDSVEETIRRAVRLCQQHTHSSLSPRSAKKATI